VSIYHLAGVQPTRLAGVHYRCRTHLAVVECGSSLWNPLCCWGIRFVVGRFSVVESSSSCWNTLRRPRILFVVLEYAASASNPSTFSSLLASSRVGTSPSPCTAGIPGFKYPLPVQGQGGPEVLVGDRCRRQFVVALAMFHRRRYRCCC
jgi:hypothetical protein